MITGSASNSTTVVTILVAVFGVLFTLIGALSMIIFNDIRKRVAENTRHLVKLARAGWGLAVRQTDVEMHLQERDDYKPVRIKDSDPPVL